MLVDPPSERDVDPDRVRNIAGRSRCTMPYAVCTVPPSDAISSAEMRFDFGFTGFGFAAAAVSAPCAHSADGAIDAAPAIALTTSIRTSIRTRFRRPVMISPPRVKSAQPALYTSSFTARTAPHNRQGAGRQRVSCGSLHPDYSHHTAPTGTAASFVS